MDSNVKASQIKHKRTTLERIEKCISDKYFADVNLFSKLYPARKNISNLTHWKVPGGGGKWEEWSVENVLKQTFTPVKIGDVFGPSWSTHWFLVCFSIPDEWKGKEVRLRWKSQSEAMVWDLNGRPIQGLSSGTDHQLRTDFRISKNWNSEEEEKDLKYLIEMSGSKMFGVGKDGFINPPNPDEKFTLELAEICAFDYEAYSLFIDLQVLHDFAKHLSEDQRGFRAMYAANQMINDLIDGDTNHAKLVSKEFFSKRNGDSCLTLALIGNCHIDTAWLWPYSETKRKCARSWSSTIRLMEDYPEMVFTCSQAQQLDWVKETYPHLFSKIKEKTAEGKFIHAGSTWVEMDGLIPSGEAFIRQFLYGLKFYDEEFGYTPEIFWLPDTFGYSGQIPQICKHFSIPYFLTQKLSWNLVNKFPHHTFIWEGIDGTSILAHFPPGDSYELNVNVEEALRSEKNLCDKGRVSTVGFLYGYGDGGGGPTQDMLERARRLRDVDGCPRMEHMSPISMFEKMKTDERNLCRWVGELYLELHNGTYTSQAKTKWYNRKCEFELRGAELLLSLVAVYRKDLRGAAGGIAEMRKSCESAWKKVLLNQFHDVIPGSSIGMVYEDSGKLYDEALQTVERVKKFCIQKLSAEPLPSNSSEASSIFNSLPWNVKESILIDNLEVIKERARKLGMQETTVAQETTINGAKKHYIVVQVPPLSYTEMCLDSTIPNASPVETPRMSTGSHLPVDPVTVEENDTGITLKNGLFRARFSKYGELIELSSMAHNLDENTQQIHRNVFGNLGAVSRDQPSAEELKGNLLTLYDDVPLFWDAWDVMDYHLETRRILNMEKNKKIISPIQIVEAGPLRVELAFDMAIGTGSRIRQKIIMTSCHPYLTFENEVDWHESHKLLKVEFVTNLLARNATYDIQFGHVERPTHRNTTWDSAKFEVCGHKWANISERDHSLTVFNDSKYGWSASGGTLCLSLLRSPKAPDDKCDMGKHYFKYGVMPSLGQLHINEIIPMAYKFNVPLTVYRGVVPKFAELGDWLQIRGEGVVIETIKVSERSEEEIVIRMYEAFGSTRIIGLRVDSEFVANAFETDGAERIFGDALVFQDLLETIYKEATLRFLPFQIRTFAIKLS